MEAILTDSIKLALNSALEGLISKSSAVESIERAALINCMKCCDNNMVLNKGLEYPLDSVTCEDAMVLYFEKGLVFNCESGHVTGMYQPVTGLVN